MPMFTMFLMGLSVKPSHLPLRMLPAKAAHLVEYLVNLGNYVNAVDFDGLGFRSTEGDVKHGAIFGDIDLVAVEHGVTAGGEPDSSASCQKSLRVSVGDAVLGIIEEDADCFCVNLSPRVGSSAKSGLMVVVFVPRRALRGISMRRDR